MNSAPSLQAASPVTVMWLPSEDVAMWNRVVWREETRSWVATSAMEGREFDVADVLVDVENLTEFTTPGGTMVRIRPTVAHDAILFGLRPYSVPVDVMAALANMEMPLMSMNLSAAVDDAGVVHTLLLETTLGLYARYSMDWIPVADLGAIENLGIVDVTDDAVGIYDTADRNGRQVQITSLAVKPSGNAPAAPLVDLRRDTAPVAVVASAPIMAPIISSAEDLDVAIEFANENPPARWYIRKRGQALGWKPADGVYPEWW